MGRFDEVNLRTKFEEERLCLLAGRLLRLTGARLVVLALDNDDKPSVWLSTGRLWHSHDYIGDALLESFEGEEKPLCDLV